jgi:hypothetical protein
MAANDIKLDKRSSRLISKFSIAEEVFFFFFFFFTRARPLISPGSTAALRLIVQP